MKRILIIGLLLTLIGQARAGVFDSRYPSARAAAMGNAYVAINHDVWAGYYNPAGLARLKNYQLASAFQRPFNQSFLVNSFLAVSVPLAHGFGTLALSAENFGVRYQKQQLSSELTLGLSHGFTIMEDIHTSLSAGYTIHYFYWRLGKSVSGKELGSAGTWGLDVGLQASIYERTFLGVYLYNINAPQMGEYSPRDLPQRFVIGAGYRPISGVLTTISFDKTVGYETEMNGGLEIIPLSWLALRLGVSTNPNRVSMGLGLHFQTFQLDYSFRNHPVLPETHNIGLIYSF